MSFNLYFTHGAVPLAIFDWAGSKLHNHTVYGSDKLPAHKEKPLPGIPRHLRATNDEIKEMQDSLMGMGDQPPSRVLGSDFLKRGDHDSYLRKGDLAIMNQVLDEDGDLDDYEEDLKDRPQVQSFMKKKLEDAKKELASRQREFNIGSGTLRLVVNPYEREVYFIVGPSGCGKSSIAVDLMKSYMRTYPDNEVYLFTSVMKDKTRTFEKHGVEPQPLTTELVQKIHEGLGQQLENCMVIFDDVDTIANKNIKEAIWRLRKELLQTGRHGSVYVLNTGHEYRAHDQTKAANKESTAVIMFPDGESAPAKDYMKLYCGLSPRQIEKALATVRNKHSWVKISRRSPKHVLYNHGGYFIDNEVKIKAPPKKKRKVDRDSDGENE